ncbi:heterokaryon incompatibility protein-domain-containing protein [Pyrenochaeta sp. MPI-SDFR-AT-0127]|nr:heterokaryon incompatibility protein-domain-containing protein [Pyrenochaeta sp. MPI-SDFR-AT-0127]
MEQPVTLCEICDKVLWENLPFEDAIGHAHHASLDSLITSAETCTTCELVLHAAVSNLRRSQKRNPDARPCYTRYETVRTPDPQHTTRLRDVIYTKVLGPAMPVMESDVVTPGRGGYFTHVPTEWSTEKSTPMTKIVAATGFVDAHDIEPVESETIDVQDLRKQVPQNMGVWLYGNWWAPLNPKSDTQLDSWYLMGIGARFGTSGHLFDSINNIERKLQIRGSALSVSARDAFPPPYMPRRFREVSSSSDIAFKRVRCWMDDCMTGHKCRGPPNDPVLPTRVLDVSVSEHMVVICEPGGKRGNYVALSHSWGNSARLTATTKNLAILKRGVALASLPKTFTDAIEITRRLGIQYLWIDCLCILQDDARDWEREASVMGTLYQNSYLTISAANSTDSKTGCFPGRMDTPYQSSASRSLGYNTMVHHQGFALHIEFEHFKGESSKISLSKEWLPGSCTETPQRAVIGSFGAAFDPLEKEPLNNRGWTLQERLLPSRIIHYAQDQMYYQCDRYMQSEDGFSFDNTLFSLDLLMQRQMIRFQDHGVGEESASFIPGTHSPSKGGRWDGGWLSLIQDYSQRKLTVSDDKLPALSGLVRILANAKGDRYFAGLWAKHLPEDLFWRIYPQEESFEATVPIKGRVLGDVKKPEKYRAPSWSWAYLDAPVRFLPLTYKSLVCRVINCSTTPSGADEYGRVKAGKLVLEGPVYEVFPRTREDKEFGTHGTPVEIRFPAGDSREVSHGDAYLDFPDMSLPANCYALFLDAGHALLLRAQGDQTPAISEHELPGIGNLLARERKLPDVLITTNDVVEDIHRHPEKAGYTFQALANAERIGIASFIKRETNIEHTPKEGAEYNEKKAGRMRLEPSDVMMVTNGESWGSITAQDPRVRVTIL